MRLPVTWLWIGDTLHANRLGYHCNHTCSRYVADGQPYTVTVTSPPPAGKVRLVSAVQERW